MLPKSLNVSLDEVEVETLPSKTYKLDIENNRITGFTDELDAIKQAIYLALSVERYEYVIYSWNYGFETIDLYGKEMIYVISEVKQRIIEALTEDDRVKSVDNFLFERSRNKLHATFTAHTIYGDVDSETEVSINGL